MPIPTLITDLSTTISSNSPAGSDTVFPDLDDYVRALSGFIASIRSNSGNGWTSPYATTGALTTLSATNLTTGTVPDGRFPATLPAASGINLTALNASNLGSGTVPDARFPATLPAASGENLTALNASNLSSGTVPTARITSVTATGAVMSTQTGSAPSYAIRAWVRFFYSGGTPTVTASGNVTSLSDNGVGITTVNFTTAMAADTYAVVCTAQSSDADGSGIVAHFSATAGPTTSAVRINTKQTDGASAGNTVDATMCVMIVN